VSAPERAARVADVLRGFTDDELAAELARRGNRGPARDVREIRGVVEAAEILQDDYRHGVLQEKFGLATAIGWERYAAGVAEALLWVLGEAPWADLERLIEGEV
jgi:hypothetical protein